MGNVTFGVPEDLAIDLKNALHANVFVETGTYKGNTAIWASRNFLKVYTIEFDKDRYQKTFIRLSNMIHTSNVRMLQGNSKEKLKEVLDKINEPVIFWLDAHGLGKLEETTTLEDEIPLMQELETIVDWQARTEQSCAILIDDARLFLNPPPIEKGYHPEYWPNYFDICDFVDVNFGLMDDSYSENNDRWYVTHSKDVIVIVPSELAGIVDNWKNL